MTNTSNSAAKSSASKPRLKRIHGVWHCGRMRVRDILGLGYSMAEAYTDWRKLNFL